MTDTRAFDLQLGDTVAAMVIALRSAYSPPQVFEGLSHNAPQPTASEFARVVADLERGLEVEEALNGLLERVPSVYLRGVVDVFAEVRSEGCNLPQKLEPVGQAIWEHVGTDGRSDAYLREMCEEMGARIEACVYNAVRIEALLSQLSPDARQLAESAATIGPQFTGDALAHASDLERDTLSDALDELLGQSIIQEKAHHAYVFAHERLYEAIRKGQ
jgi:hypothetical protein